MRFLVVEDDSVTRRVLSLFLSPYGTVDTVASGKAGVDHFVAALNAGSPYEILFLDIGLPDVMGLDVLKEIRSIEQARNKPALTPVIMLTGSSEKEKMVAAHALGVVDYLLKPILESALLASLKQLQVT